MKYIVVDERKGDMFTSEYETKEEAIVGAACEFGHLTEDERRKCKGFYILESDNPDPDAENHFDGEIVYGFF